MPVYDSILSQKKRPDFLHHTDPQNHSPVINREGRNRCKWLAGQINFLSVKGQSWLKYTMKFKTLYFDMWNGNHNDSSYTIPTITQTIKFLKLEFLRFNNMKRLLEWSWWVWQEIL